MSSLTTQALLEIRLQCPPVLAAYFEELLWTLDGVVSVSEHYASNPNADQTQLSDLSAITVITSDPLGEDHIKVLLVTHPRLMNVCDITGCQWIEKKDWAENWKQYWHATAITPHLTICPTWEEYTPASEEEIVLRLDPKCAFGTGTHETTRLMLKALERLADQLDFSQLNLLDVGTGSGILALYAAKRGCLDVCGIDNDPVAVQTALENTEYNQLNHAVHLTDTPIHELCQTPYTIITANIIAPVITELFPDILLRLKPKGYFLVSGLIESSVGTIETLMREAGLTDIHRLQDGPWFLIQGIYQ